MTRTSNRFAFWLALGRILSMLVTFFMPLVLTRVLSQSDYGVFSQFFTLYLAFFVIFSMGFHSNLFFFYPTANVKGKDEYVSNTLFLLLAMSLVAAGIMSFPFIRNLLFGEGRLHDYSLFIIICIALAIPTNIVTPLLTVREDRIGAVLYPAMAALFRVGTVVVAAYMKNDLAFVFKALIVYQALIFFWILFYTVKNHRIRLNPDMIGRQVCYSIPFGLSIALQLFTSYFDKIVSIRFLDTIQYAIYATAFLSIPGINQIYESLCHVNVVNMTKSYQDHNIQQVRDLYREFVVRTLSFSAPIILAVSLFAEEIIGFLFPNEYIASAPFFRIYSLTFLAAMLGAGTVLRAIGKTQYSLIAYAISALFGLPITYFLIKYYGIHGAIWGAVINLILPRFIQMYFEAKQTGSAIKDFLDWKNVGCIMGVALVLLVPLSMIKVFLHPSFWICIILSGVYVILAYVYFVYNNIFLFSKESVKTFLGKLKYDGC